ncbi:MAG TPA: CocE/NonD family hydrolase [Acidimicrobiales bacterium]|jgi:hypothetical protein|nr:CocE/NonD family hydrolase [Acidimicrobiales bacterium]
MKTRDGVVLRADIIRPETSEPVPAIVSRTPYDKGIRLGSFAHLNALDAAKAGFAVVYQDIRGRFASEGEWSLMGWDSVEQDDGFDCIEWVASQDWCNGRVGMIGGSYEALNAMAAAVAQPPSLRAIAPALVGSTDARITTRMLEGVILSWSALVAVDVLQKRAAEGHVDPGDMRKAMSALVDPASVASTLPLGDLAPLTIPGMPTYRELTERIINAGGALTDAFHRIEVPALLTTGWWDQAGGSHFFRKLRSNGGTAGAREDTRMIVGPWSHTQHDVHLGDLGFGQLASLLGGGVGAAHLAFFSHHLRDDTPFEPDVRYFLTGVNAWRHASDWPPPESGEHRIFLYAVQGANSVSGDGALMHAAPTAEDAVDEFDYDPNVPVPSVGFRALNLGGPTVPGPFDQSRVEGRDDVLVYSSPLLESTVVVVGDPHVQLFVSTSAPDTDFIVKLCDVSPDGTSRNIADGMVQLSWQREPPSDGTNPAKEVTSLKIDLGMVGHAFAVGHRIRLQIASSAFPHFNRNLNTGMPADAETDGVIAHQTVHRSRHFASHVVLPVGGTG